MPPRTLRKPISDGQQTKGTYDEVKGKLTSTKAETQKIGSEPPKVLSDRKKADIAQGASDKAVELIKQRKALFAANLQKINSGMAGWKKGKLLDKNAELQREILIFGQMLLPQSEIIPKLEAEIIKIKGFMTSMGETEKKKWGETCKELQDDIDVYKKYAPVSAESKPKPQAPKVAGSDVKQKSPIQQQQTPNVHVRQQKSDEKKLSSRYSTRPNQSPQQVAMPAELAGSNSFAWPVASGNSQPLTLAMLQQPRPTASVSPQPPVPPIQQQANPVVPTPPQQPNQRFDEEIPETKLDRYLNEIGRLQKVIKEAFNNNNNLQLDLNNYQQRYNGNNPLNAQQYEQFYSARKQHFQQKAFKDMQDLVKHIGFQPGTDEYEFALKIGKQSIDAALVRTTPAPNPTAPHPSVAQSQPVAQVQQAQPANSSAQTQPAQNRPQVVQQQNSVAPASVQQANPAPATDKMGAFIETIFKFQETLKNQFHAAKVAELGYLQQQAQTFGITNPIDEKSFKKAIEPKQLYRSYLALQEVENLIQTAGFQSGTREYREAFANGKQAIDSALDLSLPTRSIQPAQPQQPALSQPARPQQPAPSQPIQQQQPVLSPALQQQPAPRPPVQQQPTVPVQPLTSVVNRAIPATPAPRPQPANPAPRPSSRGDMPPRDVNEAEWKTAITASLISAKKDQLRNVEQRATEHKQETLNLQQSLQLTPQETRFVSHDREAEINAEDAKLRAEIAAEEEEMERNRFRP